MNIHIIGVGGIGSYLSQFINELFSKNQLVNGDMIPEVILYDDDDVEDKNLTYQNFQDDEVFEPKAEIIGQRYNFDYLVTRVHDFNELGLKDGDLVVCCVDNKQTRVAMYEQLQDKDIQWIDLRSHGRHIAMYLKSKKNTPEALMATLPAEDTGESGSCQLQADIDSDIIQLGNRIIAAVGAQAILNIVRGDPQSSVFTREF